MAPLVRTGGSRHTGLAAPPHRNIHEDYKSNHNVLIFSDLKGLETNVDKNIENAYDLLCALRDQGYYFCLTIDIDKASKTIIYDQDNEMISKDSFIQKFS